MFRIKRLTDTDPGWHPPCSTFGPAMSFQHTIRKPVSMEGIGLHSGDPVRLTMLPAAADTGILFRAPDGTFVPASADHVVDSHFATTLGAFGVRVRTVEHLLAAAAGCGIDNLLVDVGGGEIPAADGSARPFVDLLREAGPAMLPAPRQTLVVEEPIRVGDDRRWLELTPAADFRISYTLDNTHPVIGLQMASFGIGEETFAQEIAPARTYGFLRDVPMLRQNGLARGGSLDNAVVVGKRVVLNDHLRFRDEFVRHKVLDLVGDLALLGRPLRAHVVGHNAGHALNHQLVVAIQESVLAARRRTLAERARAAQTRAAGDLAARGLRPGIATL